VHEEGCRGGEGEDAADQHRDMEAGHEGFVAAGNDRSLEVGGNVLDRSLALADQLLRTFQLLGHGVGDAGVGQLFEEDGAGLAGEDRAEDRHVPEAGKSENLFSVIASSRFSP
jgi:hypothetical protein